MNECETCGMTNEEAIEIIKIARAEVEWEYPMEYAAAFDRAIEVLEQESKSDWIPVSERLPEPNEKDGLIARFYLVQNEYGDMLVARYDGKGWEQIYQHEYLEDDVIAWLPLPEPYKSERSKE